MEIIQAQKARSHWVALQDSKVTFSGSAWDGSNASSIQDLSAHTQTKANGADAPKGWILGRRRPNALVRRMGRHTRI